MYFICVSFLSVQWDGCEDRDRMKFSISVLPTPFLHNLTHHPGSLFCITGKIYVGDSDLFLFQGQTTFLTGLRDLLLSGAYLLGPFLGDKAHNTSGSPKFCSALQMFI